MKTSETITGFVSPKVVKVRHVIIFRNNSSQSDIDEASLRTLINQQEILQQTATRLEEVVNSISGEKQKLQRKQVSRDLSVSV